MEPRRCYKPKCTKKAEFRCNCTTTSAAFMCQAHISDHVSNKGRLHNIQSLQGIDPASKKLALDLLHVEKSKISHLKKESFYSFNQLISSLKNLLKNTLEILNMNLNSIDQKIDKIETDEISNIEIEQLISSLLSEAQKICLIDETTLQNIQAVDRYVKENYKIIIKLNILEAEDFRRKGIEDLINQFYSGNLNDQQDLTCELEKWENTIMSWNEDFKNFPARKENWYFKLGLIQFLAGETHRALSYFNFALKLNPNYSNCHFYKGIVLAVLKKKKESLECWNFLLRANRKHSFIKIIKGWYLYLLDRNAESIEEYDDFIQNNPERYFVNTLKLYSLDEEKKYEEVNAWCNEIIALNPGFSWAYSKKGWALIYLNDNSQALEWFSKALENDNNCFFAYLGMSEIHDRQNNHEESLVLIDIGISINPYFPYNYQTKGQSLYCMKRYDEALKCFYEALKLDPNLPHSYNRIGNILCLKGRYEEAIKNFDMALGIRPKNTEYQNNQRNAVQMLEEERKKNRSRF